MYPQERTTMNKLKLVKDGETDEIPNSVTILALTESGWILGYFRNEYLRNSDATFHVSEITAYLEIPNRLNVDLIEFGKEKENV